MTENDVWYKIQGTDLTDTRWEQEPVAAGGKRHTGPWELLKGTITLPGTPGFAVTRFERPDQHGESQAQFAPITPTSGLFSIRVWAIETNPANPGFRTMPTTVGGRLRVLTDNVEDLFFRTQIGAAGSKGLLEVERRYSTDGDPRWAAGRFTARSEPEYGDDYQWADYHLMFEIPHGTWYTETVTVTETVGTSWTDILVPMGTAPVWDSLVAARADSGTLQPGSRFRNDQDVGFDMAYLTNNWWVMNTVSRMAAGTGSTPDWGRTLTNARLIHEVGRPQGSALLINPGVAGNPSRVGLVRARLSTSGTVSIRYRPRYF